MASSDLKWPNWLRLVVDDLEAQRRFYGRDARLKRAEFGRLYQNWKR